MLTSTSLPVKWCPYTINVPNELPDICLAGDILWRERVYIICIDVIEWHLPNRVMRQLGMKQHIPENVQTFESSEAKCCNQWLKFWN